jgi:hypothetical protein
MMRNKILLKATSLIISILFLTNELCYGLAVRPASVDPSAQLLVLTIAQRYLEERREDLIGDVELFIEGDMPRTGIDKLTTDYTHPPEALAGSPIIRTTDLIEAFRSFRDNQKAGTGSRLGILRGDFKVKKEDAIPIYGEGEAIYFHPKFLGMLEDLRKHDIWFKYTNPDGSTRCASLAAEIFDWAANRAIAKKVGGDIVSIACRMWFFGSYCPKNEALHNNFKLEERIKFFLSEEGTALKLYEEFPPEMSEATKQAAIKLALWINHQDYKNRAEARKTDKVPGGAGMPSSMESLSLQPLEGRPVSIADRVTVGGLTKRAESYLSGSTLGRQPYLMTDPTAGQGAAQVKKTPNILNFTDDMLARFKGDLVRYSAMTPEELRQQPDSTKGYAVTARVAGKYGLKPGDKVQIQIEDKSRLVTYNGIVWAGTQTQPAALRVGFLIPGIGKPKYYNVQDLPGFVKIPEGSPILALAQAVSAPPTKKVAPTVKKAAPSPSVIRTDSDDARKPGIGLDEFNKYSKALEAAKPRPEIKRGPPTSLGAGGGSREKRFEVVAAPFMDSSTPGLLGGIGRIHQRLGPPMLSAQDSRGDQTPQIYAKTDREFGLLRTKRYYREAFGPAKGKHLYGIVKRLIYEVWGIYSLPPSERDEIHTFFLNNGADQGKITLAWHLLGLAQTVKLNLGSLYYDYRLCDASEPGPGTYNTYSTNELVLEVLRIKTSEDNRVQIVHFLERAAQRRLELYYAVNMASEVSELMEADKTHKFEEYAPYLTELLSVMYSLNYGRVVNVKDWANSIFNAVNEGKKIEITTSETNPMESSLKDPRFPQDAIMAAALNQQHIKITSVEISSKAAAETPSAGGGGATPVTMSTTLAPTAEAVIGGMRGNAWDNLTTGLGATRLLNGNTPGSGEALLRKDPMAGMGRLVEDGRAAKSAAAAAAEAPVVSEISLETLIEDCEGINTRARHGLLSNGINTIGELVEHTKKDLQHMRRMGKTSVKRIEIFLKAHGLRLATAEEQRAASPLTLDSGIERLGISEKTCNLLREDRSHYPFGIKTVMHLAVLKENKLLSINGIKETRLKEIKDRLGRFGLKLGMSVDDAQAALAKYHRKRHSELDEARSYNLSELAAINNAKLTMNRLLNKKDYTGAVKILNEAYRAIYEEKGLPATRVFKINLRLRGFCDAVRDNDNGEDFVLSGYYMAVKPGMRRLLMINYLGRELGEKAEMFISLRKKGVDMGIFNKLVFAAGRYLPKHAAITLAEMIQRLKEKKVIGTKTLPYDINVVNAVLITLRFSNRLLAADIKPVDPKMADPLVAMAMVRDILEDSELRREEQFNIVLDVLRSQYPMLVGHLVKLKSLLDESDDQRIMEDIEVLRVTSIEKEILRLAFFTPGEGGGRLEPQGDFTSGQPDLLQGINFKPTMGLIPTHRIKEEMRGFVCDINELPAGAILKMWEIFAPDFLINHSAKTTNVLLVIWNNLLHEALVVNGWKLVPGTTNEYVKSDYVPAMQADDSVAGRENPAALERQIEDVPPRYATIETIDPETRRTIRDLMRGSLSEETIRAYNMVSDSGEKIDAQKRAVAVFQKCLADHSLVFGRGSWELLNGIMLELGRENQPKEAARVTSKLIGRSPCFVSAILYGDGLIMSVDDMERLWQGLALEQRTEVREIHKALLWAHKGQKRQTLVRAGGRDASPETPRISVKSKLGQDKIKFIDILRLYEVVRDADEVVKLIGIIIDNPISSGNRAAQFAKPGEERDPYYFAPDGRYMATLRFVIDFWKQRTEAGYLVDSDAIERRLKSSLPEEESPVEVLRGGEFVPITYEMPLPKEGKKPAAAAPEIPKLEAEQALRILAPLSITAMSADELVEYVMASKDGLDHFRTIVETLKKSQDTQKLKSFLETLKEALSRYDASDTRLMTPHVEPEIRLLQDEARPVVAADQSSTRMIVVDQLGRPRDVRIYSDKPYLVAILETVRQITLSGTQLMDSIASGYVYLDTDLGCYVITNEHAVVRSQHAVPAAAAVPTASTAQEDARNLRGPDERTASGEEDAEAFKGRIEKMPIGELPDYLVGYFKKESTGFTKLPIAIQVLIVADPEALDSFVMKMKQAIKDGAIADPRITTESLYEIGYAAKTSASFFAPAAAAGDSVTGSAGARSFAEEAAGDMPFEPPAPMSPEEAELVATHRANEAALKNESVELINIISRCEIDPGRNVGPGVKRSLPLNELKDIYGLIDLTHGTRLEIVLPQSVGIDDESPIKKALHAAHVRRLEAARKRGSPEEKDEPVVLRSYPDDDDARLQNILNSPPAEGVSRIVITNKQFKEQKDIDDYLKAFGDLTGFKNTRVMNVRFPKDIRNEDELTFQQWRLVTMAIPAGLVKSDDKTGKLILQAMLEDYIEGRPEGIEVKKYTKEFVNNLTRPDKDWSGGTAERLGYFLGKTVSLLKDLIREFDMLKLRMSTILTAL